MIRIGNCSGFYGDRLSAMSEVLEGGELDVITGDYLAELTMLILFKSRAKDPTKGYATTFLKQLETCLGTVRERGVRIVVNAGGLNPVGCAEAVTALADRLGVPTAVAHVTGDDLLPRVAELKDAYGLRHLDTGAELTATPLTANAYLGAGGIARALAGGADVVVTGRVTDASLVVGPAMWHHSWGPDDLDQLAGAVVAGHVLECGAQATGGNYSFFTEIADLRHLGFPIAEVEADGSSVITKHPGTGGAVTVGTVTAQLLYEIGDARYLGPDVTTRFDTIRLEQVGQDRVRISEVRGESPPADLKVCLNLVGGLRNSVTFVLTGLDVEAKADLVRQQLEPVLAGTDATLHLARTGHQDPHSQEEATSTLRVTVKGSDPAVVGRAFSSACVELALASYPGLTMTAPPGDATPYGVYWPALVPAHEVTVAVGAGDGQPSYLVGEASRTTVEPQHEAPDVVPTAFVSPSRETRKVALGAVMGARSGDKGGNANVGVWARRHDQATYQWLASYLTVERFRELLPETADLAVDRVELPNLAALNFVVHGLLGEGVSSSTRFDPQAKGLGEWLRARLADVPLDLLES